MGNLFSLLNVLMANLNAMVVVENISISVVDQLEGTVCAKKDISQIHFLKKFRKTLIPRYLFLVEDLFFLGKCLYSNNFLF